MKRWFCATVLLTLLGAATAQAIGLESIQVSPRVWYFQVESRVASVMRRGFMANAGFVVTADVLVVFDALATPTLVSTVLAGVRRVIDRPVNRIVVSRYRADYVYRLQVFKAAGAEIWAQQHGRGYLASDLARARLKQRWHALAPSVDETTRLLAADD